jgi:hypothetical protein
MSLERLQIPYLTTIQRMAIIPIDRDLVYDTDLRKIYVGDGLTYGGVELGVQGIQGTQGIQGVQGIQGLHGSFAGQGIQGIQGIIGAQGTNWVNFDGGTPVTVPVPIESFDFGGVI